MLGAADVQMGRGVHHNRADLDRMMETGDADGAAAAFEGIRSVIISLVFNRRDEVSRRMREEIRREGWEIAGPDAYPTLTVLNTPGGGIQRAHFEDLIAAVESVPRFVHAHRDEFDDAGMSEPSLAWTDPETGVSCSVALEGTLDPVFAPIESREPADPEGPGATPLASLDGDDASRSVRSTMVRFRAWLRKQRVRGKPLSPDAAKRCAADVQLLVDLIAYASLKPVTAINEYDPRTFLYDRYPRKVAASKTLARAMLGHVRRFFDFLAERERVRCPWATAILADADGFFDRWSTFPGGFFWDERCCAGGRRRRTRSPTAQRRRRPWRGSGRPWRVAGTDSAARC